MGVTGLWTVLQPCARPIKLETLNKKRLAVDASIWIYQFLKAVRDKEGNALRNSHVVGFFRRICKLLFFGIKPVFVFDGGAPALKRQTISSRKARREGRREDAVRTAGKLLAVQMQRRAEEEDRKRREERDRSRDARQDEEEEEIPENLVYVDELQMTAQERQQSRTFRKKDAYHLPELDVGLAEMGAPNDPRIMSHEELEDYARQFHTGEDINLYDFSKIDFNGPFFLSLPASDRYNILNAARLRSRLRMGYSKDQLDTMFPDRMAFSKFQVERVKERNELTQRLMNLNGMNGEDAMFGFNGAGRVAGEKGREYVLVKNDGVEGGWALGVVSNKQEGDRNQPIDVERIGKELKLEDDDDEWVNDGFEDVPIEGLNRLPKRGNNRLTRADNTTTEVLDRRQAFYKARQRAADNIDSPADVTMDEDPESLFLPQEPLKENTDDEADNDLFEDIIASELDEEEELKRAIAMSLEDPEWSQSHDRDRDREYSAAILNGPPIDRPLQFNQRNAQAGRAFAHLTNARAFEAAPRPFFDDHKDDNDIDLQKALAGSSNTRASNEYGTLDENGLWSPIPTPVLQTSNSRPISSPVNDLNPTVGFSGPLPFESLDLGKSILTKKKKKSSIEEEEGGFEKITESEKKPPPIPPWFSGDVVSDYKLQKEVEDKSFHGADLLNRPRLDSNVPILKRRKTGEVIDLEAPKERQNEVIEVDSSGEESDDLILGAVLPVDSEVRMDDVADLVRAEPPQSKLPLQNIMQPVEPVTGRVTEPVDVSGECSSYRTADAVSNAPDEESIEWEESDLEDDRHKHAGGPQVLEPAGGSFQPLPFASPSPEFENVCFPATPSKSPSSFAIPTNDDPTTLPSKQVKQLEISHGDESSENGDIYSDPEDDDLMRQLAVEAEEHARFASTLNANSRLQSAEDYEKELRQLRNQQKKDRRDADEVSHIMVTECQQLLKLFGLPYITAPMEAEAQCAELVSLGLVDGIVTDDSDIFLFGGTRVYKNMFNQAKFVECYLAADLEKEYSLDRQRIIQIAHLLGSDYTEGLPTVGPVTALEILSEFENLDVFRDWWTEVQMGHKLPDDTSSPFRRKFKRNAAKLFLPPTFPDKRVDHAYLHPEVDSDPSPFAWGVPDLDALRGFLMATIGWSQERADEILVPVIRDMNRRENEGTQANITQFFGGGVGVGSKEKTSSGAYAPRRRVEGKSKRMESALGKLHARAKERTIGEEEGYRAAEASEDHTGALTVPGHEQGELEVASKKRRSRKRAALSQRADLGSGSENEDYESSRKPAKRRNGVRRTKEVANAS